MPATRRLVVVMLLTATSYGHSQAKRASGNSPARKISIQLEPLFWIDETHGGAAANILATDAAVDGQGRLAVLDRSRGQLHVFDSLGRELALSIDGKKKAFATPSSVVSTADGFRVLDWGRRSIIRIDSEGRLVGRDTLSGWGRVNRIGVREDGSYLIQTADAQFVRFGTPVPKGLLILDKVPIGPDKMVDGSKCGIVEFPMQPIFSQPILFAARGNLIAINRKGSAKIAFTTGKRRPDKVLTGAAPRRRATRELARQFLGDSIPVGLDGGGGSCLIDARRVIEGAGFVETVPAYSRLLFFDDQVLWAIRTSIGAEPSVADLFSFEKGYLGSVGLGQVNPIAADGTGRVLSLERVSGRPRLRWYRVGEIQAEKRK